MLTREKLAKFAVVKAWGFCPQWRAHHRAKSHLAEPRSRLIEGVQVALYLCVREASEVKARFINDEAANIILGGA